jgi:cell division protein FtsQ
MSLRARPQNRRLEQHELLEVSLPTKPRQAWRRWLAALACLAVVVGPLVGWFGPRLQRRLHELVYSNQAFALNTIEIRTDGWISPEQVREWAGVKPGDNLLSLEVARIQRDLELVPQVESASVERVLPHLLRLTLTERTPVARVQSLEPQADGGLRPAVFYLDDAGVVMPPLAGAPPPALATMLEALPLIRGLSRAELRPGRQVKHAGVQAALRLLAEFDRSPMADQVELSSVDVAAGEVLQAVTDQGAEVTFGLGDLKLQLARWRQVHAAGQSLGKAVASLDLSVSNNCPVLWLEASSAPLPKPRPVKYLPNRKRHV